LIREALFWVLSRRLRRGEGEPSVSMAFAILAAWISGAQEELDTADLAGTARTSTPVPGP